MLTLSSKSETLVNDFNDLSIKNGIDYDHSHKVCKWANKLCFFQKLFLFNSKFYVRDDVEKKKDFLK
jgi:hypothetical protein